MTRRTRSRIVKVLSKFIPKEMFAKYGPLAVVIIVVFFVAGFVAAPILLLLLTGAGVFGPRLW